jgi:hypothetical protein
VKCNGNIYEDAAVYLDDLAIAMRDTGEFFNILNTVHCFKNRFTEPIIVHLDMKFFSDYDNTLCILPMKYIEKLFKTY